MFIPKQCIRRNCAVLLAPEFNASDFLIQQVTETGLYVNIMWLGKNLKYALRLLDEHYSHKGKQESYIFFHWYPGDVVQDETNYITVKFKNNEFYNFTNNIVNGYKYEMHRLVKIVWSQMENGANPLFLGVRQFKLREQDYAYLLNLDRQGKYKVSEIACQWMKNNKKIWSAWNNMIATTPVINIGGIFPSLKPDLPFNGAGIYKAAIYATNYINKQNKLIKGYQLRMIGMVGDCKAETVMSKFLGLIVTKDTYDNLVGKCLFDNKKKSILEYILKIIICYILYFLTIILHF